MEFVDAHAHIYERLTGFGPHGEARAIGGGMVEWATGRKERFLKAEHGEYGFSYDMLATLMEEGGIGHAVLLQGSNYGFQNSYTAEAVSRYPDKFTGAGTFDPYAKNADQIFDNLVNNLGFKILKFELSEGYGLVGYHPDLTLDGKVFAPYLKAAEDGNITVVIDTGALENKSCNVDSIVKVAKRHKQLNMVLAHTFFPRKDQSNENRLELIKRLKGDHIFFDVAGYLMPNSTPEILSYFKKVMNMVGSDHVAWGTDCPNTFLAYSYRELVEYICNMCGFTDTELTNLMAKTARYVYKISGVPFERFEKNKP